MDLQSYTFGVVKGYANTLAFDSATFLTKVTVKSDVDNMAALLREQVKLII